MASSLRVKALSGGFTVSRAKGLKALGLRVESWVSCSSRV